MKYKIFTLVILSLLLINFLSNNYVFGYEIISHELLISSSLIVNNNGVVSLINQNSRNTDYIDLTSFGPGTIYINMERGGYGAVLISKDDLPQNIEIGYTFISDDFHSIFNINSLSVSIPGNCYVYISNNIPFTVTYEASNPSPSPSISPSPSPEVTPSLSPTPIPDDNGSYIPYHFDIPLDYYFVVIIILLGGVLICQFFKK